MLKSLIVSRLLIHSMSRMSPSAVLLGEARVEVRDRAGVEDKLARLIAEGPDRLQLIVDFDYTMSRAHKNGKIFTSPFLLPPNSILAPSLLVLFLLPAPLLQASQWTVRGVSWRTTPSCRPATWRR